MRRETKPVLNVAFVIHKPDKRFINYCDPLSKTVFLSREVIRILQADKTNKIETVLFTGVPEQDAAIWAFMRGGDNFTSFLAEMQKHKGFVFIILPLNLFGVLQFEFLRSGVRVCEYGRTGLEPSSLCQFIFNDKGVRQEVRILEEIPCSN